MKKLLEFSEAQNALLITMDKDFGDLIFNKKLVSKGVLLLRLEDATSIEKLSAIQDIELKTSLSQLESRFSVYQNGKLRIRNYE